MATEASYVAGLALRWARTDPVQRWVDAAPDGPTPVRETIRDYLHGHNPFPDHTRVEVLRRDGRGWEPAVVLERVDLDEWTIEYDDGERAWRDHHELRPTNAPVRGRGREATGEE